MPGKALRGCAMWHATRLIVPYLYNMRSFSIGIAGSLYSFPPISIKDRGSLYCIPPFSIRDRGSLYKSRPFSIKDHGIPYNRPLFPIRDRGTLYHISPFPIKGRGSLYYIPPFHIRNAGASLRSRRHWLCRAYIYMVWGATYLRTRQAAQDIDPRQRRWLCHPGPAAVRIEDAASSFDGLVSLF